MNKRLEQQMEFIIEADKAKNIFRRNHNLGHERRENDAEHSWHMSLMAMIMNEYANEKVDLLRVIKMLLIHDLVEIDAGDAYAYDEAANVGKREREEAAADRIFGLLPEDQNKELRDIWEEFEEGETPEAMYARVMDNFQPFSLIETNGGMDWKDNDVKKSQIYKRNEKTAAGSKEIWERMQELIDKNIEAGNIIDE